jgi:hypothetical protein
MRRREFLTILGRGSRVAARGACPATSDTGDRVSRRRVLLRADEVIE